MKDIVERLRGEEGELCDKLCDEAADEIERWRKEYKLLLDDWKKLLNMERGITQQKLDEILERIKKLGI